MAPFRLFKKPWEKELCSYVLQEYGATGSKRGWANVTEPVEEQISKLTATEFFKPGRHYRVIARYTEGDRAGQFAGVVWQYYEPAKGIKAVVKAEEEEEPTRARGEKGEEPHDPVEAVGAYADKLEADLQPIVKLQKVIRDFQVTFMPVQPAPSVPSDGEEGEFKIPPPEFDGKLPVYMHPFVVKTIFGELNAFVDHAADRFGGMFGVSSEGKPQQKPKEEEEEEPVLPSIRDFAAQPVIKEQKPTEIAQTEEEEAILPMPKKEEEKASGGPIPEFEVQPPEDSKAEVVPSLFSEAEEKTKTPKLPAADKKERKKK